MLELARIAGTGHVRRTITFISTSGGSGGAAGAADTVNALPDGTSAVVAWETSGETLAALRRRV